MSDDVKDCASPSREAYWGEVDIHEKCARMRRVIKSQEDRIDHLTSAIWTLQRQMLNHMHTEGRIFVPANQLTAPTVAVENRFERIRERGTLDEVYF